MIRTKVFVAPLLAVLLAACSDSPSTGGGGFEGETVALAGTVHLAGKRIAGASVDLLDLRTNASLGRTTTNPAGEFRLSVPAGSKGFLEVRAGDSALLRRLVETIPTDTPALEAARPTTWTARATMAGSPVASAVLRIVGSTESVTTGSDGSFALHRTAGAEWVDILLPDGSRRQTPLPPAGASGLELPAHASVLLDDFEGSDTRTRLGLAVGAGWWFTATDSASGGTSYFEQVGITADPRAGYTTTDAYSGTSFRATFLADDTRPVHYGMVGIALSGTGEWMDLSGVDSITFMMKGLGATRLELATRTSMVPDNDAAGKFGVDLDIPAQWTRIVVRKSEIVAPAGTRPALQGIPWSQDARRCSNLLFFFTGSADLQIDDIVLHGPGLSDLVPGP